jgi:leucyl-tRNA synthetase
MSTEKPNYDAGAVEAARQAVWAEDGTFEAPTPAEGQARTYVKPSSPFTSGNLHMGHIRSYSIGDAYARFRRARGDAVLFGLGFDAFGLPAELGAIQRKESPAAWVSRCGEQMLVQMKRMGFSFDYDRFFYSSDEKMYRWSQWLFVTLLEAGLIYRSEATVDWCDSCQTTLAALQVEDGKCWRCGNEVRLTQRPVWFLKIGPYVSENDTRLDDFSDWDEISLASQRIILGKTEGVEIELKGLDGRALTAFTPYKDEVGKARFILLSPRHPEVEQWASEPKAKQQLAELRSGGWERSARDASSVPIVDTEASVMGPEGGDLLPVFVSPIVDSRFGATAALGIPTADDADRTLSQRLRRKAGESSLRVSQSKARPKAAVRYRAYDFSISRQRSWGTPIPIVYCEGCGAVPVPVEQLPVRLPLDIEPTGEGNPLAEREDFVNVECPKCGKPAKRETDTLDCHFDALWMWVPACVPEEDRAESMFEHPALREWLPSERLVAGSDSGGFVFDQRVVTKALRDIGPFSFLEDGEPFAGCLFHEMVIADGRKMSKHLGNVVDPDALVQEYGADTVRLAVLYAAGPAKALNWNDGAIRYAHRLLDNIWDYSHDRFAAVAEAAEDAEAAADTKFLRDRLGKWCDNAIGRITKDLEELQMHSAVRNVARLFERIQDYEKRVIKRRGALSRDDAEALVGALVLLAQTLAPLAPHIAEQLLIASGREDALQLAGQWPESSPLSEPAEQAPVAG